MTTRNRQPLMSQDKVVDQSLQSQNNADTDLLSSHNMRYQHDPLEEVVQHGEGFNTGQNHFNNTQASQEFGRLRSGKVRKLYLFNILRELFFQYTARKYF